ncbi:MAG: type II secretion system protein M [Gammaproteobacteria bacterium]|nr:type II secretion system protein M [Gammaproteobacteria bacterium]MCP4090501.1 type II secretion system protein M [Gammaproteobacteria bacterium]MCP4276634.1 type II secretion system protein M [Gammaproteobacteria bacterium]MCP4831384.1 type II secretion system protein M [Gammaproteobacteria bacterium]MCP4927928.1 type II secretion system protein M [Gammaproteobacteria bacterium]
MNPKDELQNWFLQLAPRERVMVSICAVFVLLTLLWSFALQPIFSHSADLENRVTEKQAQLANLQEMASQIRPGADSVSGPSVSSNDSIVVVIDRTTRSRQLAQYLKRNQPDGNNVRLRFEGAPFDVLVAWLGELKQNYGMTMVTANFDEAGTGRINCSLVITRAGNW